MSGDLEQEYFADGMVEDIITGLSRIKWLFVIARNSSPVYKGKATDVPSGRPRARRALCSRRQRAQGRDRLRITAQLVEAQTGAHLWADKLRRRARRHFDLQDRSPIVSSAIIEPSLRRPRSSAPAKTSRKPRRLRPLSSCPIVLLEHDHRSGDLGA